MRQSLRVVFSHNLRSVDLQKRLSHKYHSVLLHVSSARRARTDVHILADVRAIPLNVAHDARASAVGASARDEGRPA